MRKDYVLITPAYNEEEYIEKAIKSVIAQTIRPKKWVIVNDGSTDATGEIVSRYKRQYDFIVQLKLVRKEVESYYSHRACVFLSGYEDVKDSVEYDFVSNLDADIIIEPTYYERILQEFDRNPRLGIAGGVYVYHVDGQIEETLIDELCVPGSIQMFRRECYEQIGGYIPLKYGGDDSLANIMARMHGWETWSFAEHPVIQQRFVGTGDKSSILLARFKQGLTDYGIATRPLFMFVKLLRRVFLEKPYFTGSVARMAGFLYGYLHREERRLPGGVARFVRKEQMQRLLYWKRGEFKRPM